MVDRQGRLDEVEDTQLGVACARPSQTLSPTLGPPQGRLFVRCTKKSHRGLEFLYLIIICRDPEPRPGVARRANLGPARSPGTRPVYQ